MFAGGLVDTEIVHGEQAAVRAALATDRAVRGRKRFDFLEGQQRRGNGALGGILGSRVSTLRGAQGRCVPVACKQGRPVGAHVARNVRTDRVHTRQLLERAQHGVVQEGTALHDDLFAHVVRVADFNDLEQRVLDDGDGKASRNVAHRGAFLLRLLHAAVHEHGAAAAQIDRRLCLDGRLRKLSYIQVQARCEAFYEAATARRARFVEHDVVDHAVFHAQTLHVLATDVEDELDARQHFLRTAQMRNRLDFARVDAQCLQQQRFAVAGHGGMPDGHERIARFGIARQFVVHGRKRGLRASQNVALLDA